MIISCAFASGPKFLTDDHRCSSPIKDVFAKKTAPSLHAGCLSVYELETVLHQLTKPEDKSADKDEPKISD